MHTVRRFAGLIPMLALALTAACSDMPTTPEPALSPASSEILLSRSGNGRGGGVEALQIVSRQRHAPAFARNTEVILARVGEAAEATLYFRDGTPFATFRISEESMKGATLNGRPLREGRPVAIRIRSADRNKFVVDMQPSGLVFNADAPAEVEFYYDYADFGLNSGLSVLKQHTSASPWERAESWDDRKGRRMRGRVDDFTIYALASSE